MRFGRYAPSGLHGDGHRSPVRREWRVAAPAAVLHGNPTRTASHSPSFVRRPQRSRTNACPVTNIVRAALPIHWRWGIP
jgi:hypothetical protein